MLRSKPCDTPINNLYMKKKEIPLKHRDMLRSKPCAMTLKYLI